MKYFFQYLIIILNQKSGSQMDRLIDKFPYKKMLYLNWYEAAIGHLLLFKYYVQRFTQNVYFLISEQGIILKATTLDYLKRVDQQLNKFFTAKIQELQLSGSADFYNNIIEDIKEETQKLKDARDCPYINLVYSDKLRNSCIAMKNHGYTKPYEGWQCHQRERKGFCFLIVRPQHRWKQIASNVQQLARKRYPSQLKQTTELTWPVLISYQKFIWFYLKESFKTFKKSLQISHKKDDELITIVIKKDNPQFNDFQKQIQSLTFQYCQKCPKFTQQKRQNKIIILNPLQIQRVTELIYHEFGLTSFARQLRKKNLFLVISCIDISSQIKKNAVKGASERSICFQLSQKQDIICINNKKISTVINRLGKRHSIVSYQGTTYVQLKIQKPIKQNYQKIIKVRLPCLPRYYYWYQTDRNYFLLRSYITQKFNPIFEKSKLFEQITFMYNLICIMEQLHQRSIYIGSALNDCIFVDEKRLIIQPDQSANKEEDVDRLKRLLTDMIEQIKQSEIQHEIKGVFAEAGCNPFGIIQYLQDFIDSNS